MQDAGDVRRVFVHIGLRKTGTSFLQSHLWGSADLLRERGIRLVPSTRERAVVAMRAARGRLDDAARIQRALAQLRRDAQEAPEPTLLMTQESLAGATTEEAATLLESFVGREVHVVVTARDIARQLPSAWQQRVKAGFDIGFEDYLREVQEAQDDAAQGGGAGRAFWEHQDLVAVLARWSELVTRQRVHVVTVPARDADRRLLPERFGAVLGVDFEELRSDEVRANDSLDPVQVELLRRVNRLQPVQGRRQRADTVKNYFVTDILAPRRSAPARTPRELNDWCLEEGYRQVKALRRGGYHVVGDPDDLLPRQEDFGPAVPDVSDGKVAEVAVQAVADLLARHHDQARELAELRVQLAARSTPAARPEVRPRWRGW